MSDAYENPRNYWNDFDKEEARRQWCPFVRLEHGNNARANQRNPEQARCIANDCMAWRDNGEGTEVGFCGLMDRGPWHSMKT